MKDRKMVRNKQHWFTKGKSSMAKMIAFSDERLALWMRERIGYCLLQEHFLHSLPQPPYRKTRVIASGWVNNKVDEAAEWSVVQRNWRLVRTAALQEGSMLRPILFNLLTPWTMAQNTSWASLEVTLGWLAGTLRGHGYHSEQPWQAGQMYQQALGQKSKQREQDLV